MSGHSFGNMRPIAEVGDLVRCDGYGAKVFIIDAYTHELSYDSENSFEDIYYDMTDALTKEYTLGGQEDIFVVCNADKADAYLAEYRRNGAKEDGKDGELPSEMSKALLDWAGKLGEGGNYMSKEFKPTPRELSSQEAARRKQERDERADKVNVLLDEMRDYDTLITMFGDIEGEYQAKIDGAKAKLAEITSGSNKEAE